MLETIALFIRERNWQGVFDMAPVVSISKINGDISIHINADETWITPEEIADMPGMAFLINPEGRGESAIIYTSIEGASVAFCFDKQ